MALILPAGERWTTCSSSPPVSVPTRGRWLLRCRRACEVDVIGPVPEVRKILAHRGHDPGAVVGLEQARVDALESPTGLAVHTQAVRRRPAATHATAAARHRALACP